MASPPREARVAREALPRPRLARLLFPDPPRSFRGQRAVKIGLRAVHVLCAGVLVAAHHFGEPAATREAWLLATALSGVLLLALDLTESAAFLLQTRGWFVLLKVGVLAIVPALGSAATWLLVPTFLGAVLMSHAPSSVRYFLLVGRGKVRGAESKG